ncbi:MAG TPA: hypothetical protein V6C86_17795 [Oculatellaceae cyanobacterium]
MLTKTTFGWRRRGVAFGGFDRSISNNASTEACDAAAAACVKVTQEQRSGLVQSAYASQDDEHSHRRRAKSGEHHHTDGAGTDHGHRVKTGHHHANSSSADAHSKTESGHSKASDKGAQPAAAKGAEKHPAPEVNEPRPSKYLPSLSGFTSALNSYWQRISHAKSHHQFVIAFPPVYAGMDAPKKQPPTVVPAPESIKSTGKMPSLNDLYGASRDLNRIVSHDKTQPDFHPLTLSEADFKRRYAEESIFIGKQYNLNKATVENLVKRIYAFEDGGWGTYNTLSSMPQALMNDDQKNSLGKFHPSSSALGYNQLLLKDTVNDIAHHGAAISARLEQLATQHPDRAKVLHDKAKLVTDLQDVILHRANPDMKIPADKHKRFYASSGEIEKAAHSLNLDGDIGPVIQSQELNNLLAYARDNKFDDFLNTKATLETSHAAEYDKLTPQQKAAAADQLLSLVQPTDADPAHPEILAAFNNVKEGLRRKFLTLGPKGSQSSLERDHLSADEYKMMNAQILTIRRFGGEKGPLSHEARALLDRTTFDYFGGYSADRLQAAAIELANLAGMGSAQKMLNPDNANLPTSNFFARPGYQGNPVTSRRSASELLLQIYRIMHGPNSDPSKPGIKQFNDAFNSIRP